MIDSAIPWSWLDRQPYVPLWERMQQHTDARNSESADEIWFTEHPPVFTLGLAADPSHVLGAGDIPVVKTDRGGEVTYHGPGQLMMYPLLDVRRARLGVRALVCALERSVITLCARHGIEAVGRRDAPGVYVDGRKLASIGIRIRRGASYHGLALNVDMDLEPFARINPCGFSNLEMIDLARLGVSTTLRETASQLAQNFSNELSRSAPLPATA
ncbi:MAG: lipoyl(octanoyl) transferase LipB [Pseudomonadota bacterium]